MFRVVFFLVLAIFALGSTASWGYNISPMVIELRPAGSGTSTSLTITNTHEVPVAIEISAYKRSQKEDGSDDLTPETEDLIITPPQMIIPPGTSQSVRIQWVGEASPDLELPYRIVTEQLPIRLTKVQRNDRTADISMKYRYEAALYIVPDGAKPEAVISHAEVVSQDGEKMVRLTLNSQGTKRAILDSPKVKISSSGSDFTLEGEEAKALQGLNILPNSKRVVYLPAPNGISEGKIEAVVQSGYLFVK